MINVYNVTDIFVFDAFCNSLSGMDYVVLLQNCSFDIIEGSTFKIDDLHLMTDTMETMYGERPVIGVLQEVDFSFAQKIINHYLSYVSEGLAPRPSQDQNLIAERTKQFWTLASTIMSIPPEYSYSYEPKPGTRFDMGFMWNMVFVFITGTKGILIAMGTQD